MSILYEAISSFIGLKVNRECLVSWIDKDALFTSYIDLLDEEIKAGNKKYKLVRFQGSFLESILSLNELMQDTKKPDCLVYIPYIGADNIDKTPFLEVLKSSISIPSDVKELLDQVSGGYLSPDQLRKVKSSLPANFQQLESILSGDNLDLSIFESPKSVIEFAKNLLSNKTTLLDNVEKHPKGTLLKMEKGFEKTFGYFTDLTKKILGERDEIAARASEDHSIFRLPLGFFLLGREYVMDLQNCKPYSEDLVRLQELGKLYLPAIQEVLNHLRDNEPSAYHDLSKEIQGLGIFGEEIEKRSSKELGSIDTFYFEDTVHQTEAFRFLNGYQYEKAISLHRDRQKSFWKKNDPRVSEFWNWIELTANLADSITKTKLSFQQTKSLEEAMERYSQELYKIDREYRSFGNSTEALMQSSSQNYKEVSNVRKLIRLEYSDWLNLINHLYQSICKANGFLPTQSRLQQRFFYHNFVSPLLEQGKTAVFFVDAMRYEIGVLLNDKLLEAGIKSVITPMYAELPTITSVGMNALVPSEKQGSLEPILDKDKKSIRGFKAGNRQVSSVEDRRLILKEISRRNVEWITLDEIHRNYKELEPKLKSSQFTVIHSLEIDDAGENGFLSKGFDFFEDTISKIKIGIERLRESGYENFSIVSDHGFIQYEIDSEHSRSRSESPVSFRGKRRYVIQEDKITSPEYSAVSMDSLLYLHSPYDLVFLKEPKVFKDAPTNKGFFHGGNSLQERIIPVITIQSDSKKQTQIPQVKYEIEAEIKLSRDRHSLELQVVSKNDNVLFKENQVLLLELHEVENVRIRILQSNTVKFSTNEIEIEPNRKYSLEFEVITPSEFVFQEKASVRIWSPSLKSKIEPWISNVKIPLRGNTSANVETKKETVLEKVEKEAVTNLPANLESDIQIILRTLLSSSSGMITEIGIHRIFADPRKSARALRQFSIFLQDRSNELEFSVSIEYSGEGKIYKLGNK